MLEFFSDNFSDCVFLAVMLMAMIPTIESKVAIPFAMAGQIWGENALSPGMAFLSACLGSMLPAIVVILLARLIKNKTSGFVHDKFVSKIQEKYKTKFSKLDKKESTFKKCLLLSTFVAVPLPLTGVYTGSLIAGFTNLKIWQSFVSIFVGEIFSCLAILLVCLFFENSAFYIFVFSLIFVALYLIINVAIFLAKKILIKRHKENVVENDVN